MTYRSRKTTRPHASIDTIPKRLVRIDEKTQIEVSMDISDLEARERYYNRHVLLRNKNIPPIVREQPLIPEEIIPPVDEISIEEIEPVFKDDIIEDEEE